MSGRGEGKWERVLLWAACSSSIAFYLRTVKLCFYRITVAKRDLEMVCRCAEVWGLRLELQREIDNGD